MYGREEAAARHRTPPQRLAAESRDRSAPLSHNDKRRGPAGRPERRVGSAMMIGWWNRYPGRRYHPNPIATDPVVACSTECLAGRVSGRRARR
jgi:hypothetical protein